jgi:hypothetical protein
MALTPDFEASQSAASPEYIILADTSTGSDVAITERRAYITDYAGNYLVTSGTTTDYNLWPLADTTINYNLLTRDMALSIKVDWVDGSGNVIETLTQTFCFSYFTKIFAYQLVQNQVLPITPPPITLDLNFDYNLAVLWTSIKGAINAVELANDISASQSCLNRAYNLMQNQSIYF